MTNRRAFLGGLLAVAVAGLTVSGCAPKKSAPGTTGNGVAAADGDVIPVGEFGGYSGATASFGEATHNGVMLAVDEINAAGGINGKKIALTHEDNESLKEKVRPVVTKLITQDNSVAILGEVASSRSIAAASVCDQYKTPMISPSSTNPAVTVKENGEVRDYVFRVCFIDPFQGEAMAKFLRENLKVERVAVLRNVKEDYSKGLADYFVKNFKEMGGTITKDLSYSTGDTDFRAQLTSIKPSNPQAIFVPGYYTEIGLIAKQAKELGLDVPLAGGDGWDDPETAKNPAMEGHYFTNHYSVDSDNPQSKQFVDAYQKKYGQLPNGLSALGYDATMILADAMKRSNSLKGPELRDAIAATKDFKGVTGTITLNEQHNAIKPAVVLQYKGGKQVLVDTIQPDNA